MISKDQGGVGYLAGTGVSLVVVLVWWFAIRPTPDLTAFVGTVTGVILAGALVYLASWLVRSDLGAGQVWAVAAWGATGLAIPTVPILAAVLLGVGAAGGVDASVLVSIAAASAVVGALFGAVTELEAEHLRVRSLHRRNVVLNRVLRHDVRNDASVVLLCTEHIEDEFGSAADPLTDPIRRKTEEIVERSRTARRIEALEDADDRRPVDLADVVAARARTERRAHPEAAIETDLPDAAWVRADDLLSAVVDNLVENAIEHADRSPVVRLSVDAPARPDGSVELRVADNGPGMPARTAELLERDGTDPRDASEVTGLGLWLVKWFVETFDGTIAVEANRPRGTVVRVRLPAAAEPPGPSDAVELAFG